MKIILTEKELQQIEMAAVQKVVQDKLQNLIEAKAEEIIRELGDEPISLVDIHKKYLSHRIIDAPKPGLLIPAGAKLVN